MMASGSILRLILSVAAGYLLGNISPATIMGRLQGVDIRKEGSGNPGTTNTLRVLGAKSAVITLIIDILKGVAAVLIGRYFGGTELAAYAAGTAAFLGHLYPAFYGLKGGKGIATGFGILLILDWRIGLIAMVAAVLGALFSKRMSVGSLAAAVSLPVAYGILHGMPLVFWGLFIGAMVFWRHRSNIQRLINHEEPTIGFLDRKKKEGTKHD